MISNICTFLLCSFAITSNIKTIQSAGNQITPIRFIIQSSYEGFIHTLNNLQTLNKCPVVIGSSDRKILAEPDVDNIKKYKKKLISRDKLEKKAQDIKCSFCAIAKSNILDLKNIVKFIKSGEPFIDYEATIKRHEEEAKIILRILLREDLETGKWLWIYFLKIVAIRHYEENKHFIHENPFEDVHLLTDVSEFVGNCIANDYLPLVAVESNWVSENQRIFNDMFFDLRISRWVNDVLYDRALVTTEFLYLKPFWDDENQLLFKEITEVNIDWSKPKQQHEAEVAITKEFVGNRIWMYEPYGRLDHQHLLVNIVDARIYCSLFLILYVYEKQLSILHEQILKHLKGLIHDVIRLIMKITASKDEFLVIIMSEFDLAKVRDFNDIKDILARVRTKVNEILNDLNVASTSGIDRFSVDVNEHQLSISDLIIRIIKDFEDYLNEFVGYCMPFAYKVLLHFMDEVKLSAARYI